MARDTTEAASGEAHPPCIGNDSPAQTTLGAHGTYLQAAADYQPFQGWSLATFHPLVQQEISTWRGVKLQAV